MYFEEYKKITFPVRVVRHWEHWEQSILVGSEYMLQIFKQENPRDLVDIAAEIDEEIAYYIPHNLLLQGSDNEIITYIEQNIDEHVFKECKNA